VSSANTILFVQYVLGEGAFFTYLLLISQVVTAISLVPWLLLSKKIGKKRTFYVGRVIALIGQIMVCFVTTHDLALFIVATVFSGAGNGVVLLIPWAMLPDVMEQDELHTSQKREGVFYALFVMAQKMSLAIALAASNYALGIAGYVPPPSNDDDGDQNDAQPESVIWTLRFLLGIIPIICSVISCFFVWLYPITKESHEEIKRLLAIKREEKAQKQASTFRLLDETNKDTI